jgi:hypothetical protein
MPLAQVSERRIAANRANARKSTGPRSAAGKRASSQNACQHHLYAQKFRMSPEAEAANHARALRDSAHIEDPALRELYYRLILLTGHCELNWSYRDGLEAYAHSLYPGDSQMAIWWMLHQDGLLLALHRHECFYNRQILEILTTIEKLQRAANKQSRPRRAAKPAQPQPQPNSDPKPASEPANTPNTKERTHCDHRDPAHATPRPSTHSPIRHQTGRPERRTRHTRPNTKERTHFRPHPSATPAPLPRPRTRCKHQNTKERTHCRHPPPPRPSTG